MAASKKKVEIQVSARDKASRVLKKITGAFKKWGGGALKITGGVVAGVGAVTVALGAMFSRLSDSIDEQAKMASALGLSNEALGAIRDAAGYAGISVSTLNTALRKMSQGIGDAANGTGEAKDALKHLGLSADDLQRMGPEKAFQAIIEKLSGMESGIQKTTIAMDIFGRSGAAMANLTSKGLRQAKQDADALGLKLNSSQAKIVEDANDAWAKVKNAATDFLKYVTAKLAPGIKSGFDKAFEFIKGKDLKSWGIQTAHAIASAFKNLIVVLSAVGEGVVFITRGLIEAFKLANDVVKRYSSINYAANKGKADLAENNLKNMKEQGVPESNYYYQQAVENLKEAKEKSKLYIEMNYQASMIEESLTNAAQSLSNAQGFSQSSEADAAMQNLDQMIGKLKQAQEKAGQTAGKSSGRIEIAFQGTEEAINIAKERTQEFHDILEKTGGVATTAADTAVARLGRVGAILDDIKRKAGEANTAIAGVKVHPPTTSAEDFADMLETAEDR